MILGGLLLVDDHPIIAMACGIIFESIGAEKIISAHDLETGFNAFIEHRPEVSIIDLAFPGEKLGGIALIKRIRLHDRSARILVFSMRSDRTSFLSAIEAGAMGYIIKDSSVHEFAKAVGRTRSGHRYIDPKLALNLAFPKNGSLSLREKQILEMLLDENRLHGSSDRNLDS